PSLALHHPPPTALATLSLHDALPISAAIGATLVSTPIHEGHIVRALAARVPDTAQVFVGSSMPIRAADSFWPHARGGQTFYGNRSEEHTSELQSRFDLVCRLLLEKKK